MMVYDYRGIRNFDCIIDTNSPLALHQRLSQKGDGKNLRKDLVMWILLMRIDMSSARMVVQWICLDGFGLDDSTTNQGESSIGILVLNRCSV